MQIIHYMVEEYREIKGYEGLYKISNFGNVISESRLQKRRGKEFLSKEILLKKGITGGYYLVGLLKDSIQKSFRVHQLVAIAFLGHTPDGHNLVIDHIDGDTLNNRVDNLRIVTSYENCFVGFRKDRNKFTSKYLGVFFNKNEGKWSASSTINGNVHYLGRFDNELDAANKFIEFKNSMSNLVLEKFHKTKKDVTTTKVCSKCGEDKEFSEFDKRITGKQGLQSQCKLCKSEGGVEYRLENENYNKEYYIKNKEK